MKRFKHLLFGVSFFLAHSCAPTYIQDPNANVIVTAQYRDEAPQIILNDVYRPHAQVDCRTLNEVECARKLYEKGIKIFIEAKSYQSRKLQLMAMLEYNRALSRFIEAEIRLKRAKTTIYDDWRTAILTGLSEKITRAANKCESKIEFIIQEQ